MARKELLHYTIVGPLGQGAMGEVFRAVDQKLGREVALKMLPNDIAAERTSQARLVREARAASALNHPGIVTLHDIESVDGQSFIVMELVEGERFSDLAAKRLPWRRVLELIASVGESLAFAHARDVLHRDIKADNLMLTSSGQTKVLDFGLAKLREEAGLAPAPVMIPDDAAVAATVRSQPGRSDLTQAGQLVGTPAYMAPECFEGKSGVQTEVFALGIVLYEMLVGKRPFDRETATATMIAIQMDEADPPSRLRDDLTERIDAIVAKAIAKDPAARYGDMPAFVADLRDASRVRAKRWPWIAAAGGAVIAASGITYALIGRGEDPLEITVGKTRRLTFDQGCEEYPRLHPDGKRVVYDGMIDGDYEIQVRNLDGTNRQRLTTTKGWDYASSVSPDGKHIAYVHEEPSGRSLRVVGIDGGESRDFGAISGYPAWSANGHLLFGGPQGGIVELPLDGEPKGLGRLPAGARLYHLVEVPNAGVALLWWTSSEADATALGELDRDGKLRVIEETSIDYEGGLAPARSRRGYYATRKAATEGNQLLFRPWGGGKAVVVGGGLSPGAGIDIALDGKLLVFSTCLERQYIARIAGGKSTAISQGKWQDTNPRVLDDKRILITSDRTGTMQGWLLEGDNPRPVTPPGALGAAPSPDGKLVVYVTRAGLAVTDMNGVARQLTTDASDTSPSFTHDGSHVLFERTNATTGTEDVYRIPTTGGDVVVMVASGTHPSASPVDDSFVFLTTEFSGKHHVVRGRGETVTVLDIPPGAWQRPRFSPDGNRVVVVGGFQQIVTAPADASGPSTVEWTATTGSVSTADFARDGSIVAALGDYDGDLWLAEGAFP